MTGKNIAETFAFRMIGVGLAAEISGATPRYPPDASFRFSCHEGLPGTRLVLNHKGASQFFPMLDWLP